MTCNQQFVWVFTAESFDHGREVIAVTDYDPEVVTVAGGASDKHLWELLEQYLQKLLDDPDLFAPGACTVREFLDQYSASEFEVFKMPVLTGGPLM